MWKTKGQSESDLSKWCKNKMHVTYETQLRRNYFKKNGKNKFIEDRLTAFNLKTKQWGIQIYYYFNFINSTCVIDYCYLFQLKTIMITGEKSFFEKTLEKNQQNWRSNQSLITTFNLKSAKIFYIKDDNGNYVLACLKTKNGILLWAIQVETI
jgi:hypothetical protein